MPVAAFRAVGSSLVPGRRTSSYQASFIVVNFIAIKIALLADDNAYLTDTPVFELLASGRAKEVSPLLSLSWILALSNAFISDVYTQSLPAKIQLFFYVNEELVVFFITIVFFSLFISTQFLMPRLLTDSGTSSKKPAVAHSGTTHSRFLN